MASVAAATALMGISSSQQKTLCESAENEPGETTEDEVDPYDNLPREDEPTHCSICLTYRQGPCRPYWRKVEACTKDGEKEQKKKDEEDKAADSEKESKDKQDDDDDSSMESARCFKYMMPWIDCASKYRNLYTLIEMHTNYTEGIEELEATSRHFCWLAGKEPTIDWSNWKEYSAKEENKSVESEPYDRSLPLWKTFDPALGDAKFVSIEAQVPATINDGEGILECAYAVDQDNNVIGFAYGTKPSELMKEEEDKEAGSEEGDETNKMVTLGIKLVESRTEGFTLAASYTHRIEGSKTDEKGEKSPMGLESHLYKSKPFGLAKPKPVPKLYEWVAPKGGMVDIRKQ